MNGWFVTGTGTGVGKTIVAAALCAAAAPDVVYVKPVQAGAADGEDDAADVRALADVPTVVGPVVGPNLPPGFAVRSAGASLDAAELVDVVRGAHVRHTGARLVVEGCGGVLVELGADGTTNAELAGRLELPVVVVARPDREALNHTVLTLEALEGRGLQLAGVVVSGYPAEPDALTRAIVSELQRLSGGRLVGVVPLLASVSPEAFADAADWLAPALGGRAEPSSWLSRAGGP